MNGPVSNPELALCSLILAEPFDINKLKVLTPEHLNGVLEKKFIAECMALVKAGRPIDLLTVTEAGRGVEGWSEFLTRALGSYAVGLSVESVEGVLLERWRAREMQSAVAGAEEQLARAAAPDEVGQTLGDRLAQISTVRIGTRDALADGAREVDMSLESQLAGNRITGIETGIAFWDALHGGLQPARYYALGGRPGTGKTALASQAAINMVLGGRSVLFISLEMTDARLLGRMAAHRAGVAYSQFLWGTLPDEHLKRMQIALGELKASPLHLICPTDLTANQLRSSIIQAHREHQVQLVVVDYLQKITVPQGQEVRVAIAEASDAIHRACKETGVPALVLVQLNRQAETERRPRLGHLKESGAIEQDADAVDLLWPEEDRDKIKDGPLPVILSAEKNRDGPQADQRTWFYGDTLTFKDRV